MYAEKIEDILNDVENKDLEIAGGAVVGIALSTTNSLIKYICNLTIGKKKYENVQDKIHEISERAEELKQKSLYSIDKDKEVLENILDSYKNRKDKPDEYQNACKEAVEFALDVIKISCDTYYLANEVSEVGNKMLASDFEICKYYAKANIEASKENFWINFNGIIDDDFKIATLKKYNEILS